jgi:hypothetical protein
MKLSESSKNQSIPGYQHPEKQIVKQIAKYENQYKIFDSESKNDYIISTKPTYATYATFTDKASSLYAQCPECNEEALYECDCVYKDKQCKYGHIWFISQNKIIKGDPH